MNEQNNLHGPVLKAGSKISPQEPHGLLSSYKSPYLKRLQAAKQEDGLNETKDWWECSPAVREGVV